MQIYNTFDLSSPHAAQVTKRYKESCHSIAFHLDTSRSKVKTLIAFENQLICIIQIICYYNLTD